MIGRGIMLLVHIVNAIIVGAFVLIVLVAAAVMIYHVAR